MNKILIISDIGRKIGLGHYVRAKVVSEEINFSLRKLLKFIIYFSTLVMNIKK